MQCSACARTIEARLAREPSVRHVEVKYPAGTVRLLLDHASPRLDDVIALLHDAGYRIEPLTAGETPR
ncbi:MAG: hypothetical protein ABT20_02755 [Rubrivivax sp. SCN 70-15]|nr:MAG: hypothetical protein ABT20_02755 [Rubrivivax sp. SCN 70-15]